MRRFPIVTRSLLASLALAAALMPILSGPASAEAASVTSAATTYSANAGSQAAGAPGSSMPPTSSSLYVYSADPAKLAADGARAGSQATTASNDLVVLMFGCPFPSGAGQGTVTYDNSYASTSQIEAATEAFITGYLSNALPAAHLSVVVGTSNYGNHVTAQHGTAWGGMMNDIDGWVAGHALSSRVSTYGGNDIEGGWGPPDQARAWVDAYHAATKSTLYNFGDTEGLPTTDGGAVHSPYGWTFDDYWYVAWGSGNTEILPQIYNTTFAREWNELVRYSLTKTGYPPMRIIGVLTMQQDARQTYAGPTLSPEQAWNTLTNLLNSDPRTAQTPGFSSDMMRDWLP